MYNLFSLCWLKKRRQFDMFFLLAISIGIAINLGVMLPFLQDPYAVQDDVRQSVFAMWKLWDSSLFPDSFFADLYRAHHVKAPLCYLTFQIAPLFTDDLVWYTKCLAVIIGILTIISGYLFLKQLTQKSYLAMAFTIMLSVTIWCTDHVALGYARAYIWFGIFAYMYLRLLQRYTTAGIFCLLLLLLNPITFLICLVMEFFHGLLRHGKNFFMFSTEMVSCIGNSLATLLIHVIVYGNIQVHSTHDTKMTLAEMSAQPEFFAGGRNPILGTSIWGGSWWNSENWGIGIGYLPIGEIVVWATAICILLVAVKLVIGIAQKNTTCVFPAWLSLASSTPAVLCYSSISLYILAIVSFPLLYMPSRFIAVSFLILSLIIICGCCDQFFRFVFAKFFDKNQLPMTAAAVLVISALFWLHFQSAYFANFLSITPRIAEMCSKLPKNALVVGHPMLRDMTLIPMICKRQVLVDHERSVAHNLQDLREIRRRNRESLLIVYARTHQELQTVATRNNITHVLAHKGFYTPQYARHPKYVKPYAILEKNLLQRAKGNFYLDKILDHRNEVYTIFAIANLK